MTWSPEEIATGSRVNCSGACADDHINIKADSTIELHISRQSIVHRCCPTARQSADPRSEWNLVAHDLLNPRIYEYSRNYVLDEPHDRLYFFVTSSEAQGNIDYKITSMSSPSFVDGDGDPFIQNPTDTHINNATSTKQNITSGTGLLVMAADDTSSFYVHNYIIPSAIMPPQLFRFPRLAALRAHRW